MGDGCDPDRSGLCSTLSGGEILKREGEVTKAVADGTTVSDRGQPVHARRFQRE